jgi:hypothetical protein
MCSGLGELMNRNPFAHCSIGMLAMSFTIAAAPAFAQGFGAPVMDITGHWANRQHEDSYGRTQGEELGDYTGTPLNEAARQRADLWDAALYGLDEWQCRPHTSPNIWRSVYPAHITRDVEPVTGETIAYHINFQNLIDRVIWMDGRPHPSDDAPHTWAGFSTGKWEGDILTVTTTHLKEYILKRNGVPHSDRATMVEHIMRHGDFLTIVQIVTDPMYYEEPFIQSTDFALDLKGTEAPVLCEIGEETDHPRGWVPHRSREQAQKDLEDFAKKHNLPIEAVKGGAETTYPEYRTKLRQAGVQ